jgi:hypothetical protein
MFMETLKGETVKTETVKKEAEKKETVKKETVKKEGGASGDLKDQFKKGLADAGLKVE